jgi:hypothetical protein
MTHLDTLIKVCLFGFCVTFTLQSNAQSSVTQIYTDYNGFWTSGITSNNLIHPDSSHNLLAFSCNGTTFATGVNNSRLALNNITFETTDFVAFDIAANAIKGNEEATYIGVGYNYKGKGPVTPLPVSNNISAYITDGIHGLNLGTAVFNMPPILVSYPVTDINSVAFNDGMPDVVLTHIGDLPVGASDSFWFENSAGIMVGSPLSVDFSVVQILAQTDWKFYRTTNPPIYTNSGKATRDLRMAAFDLADFGLTTESLVGITKFVHKVNGENNQAFLAHNTASFTAGTGVVLSGEIASFNATKSTQTSILEWTAGNVANFSRFEVERSIDNAPYFTKIESISINGDVTSFSYEDKMPVIGANLYRLKLVDQDGNVSYSATKTLIFDGKEGFDMYPNPVRRTLHLNLPQNVSEILLYDLKGNVFPVSLFDVMKQKTINVSTFPAGTYSLRVVAGADVIVKRFEIEH